MAEEPRVYVCMRVADRQEPAVSSTVMHCDRCREQVWIGTDGLHVFVSEPELEIVCNQCIVPDLIMGDKPEFYLAATREKLPEELSDALARWTIEDYGLK